jgi:hypothetical protein
MVRYFTDLLQKFKEILDMVGHEMQYKYILYYKKNIIHIIL